MPAAQPWEDTAVLSAESTELFDIPAATHFDPYHRDAYASQAVDKLAEFYGTHLKN
ncbi:hypothetical protein [Streptomyces sp. NPDC127033]|uniref:hypothetical protein n=1 Tax=Streptomyces sp. NPDC127033 TaxID=3347110 RepID=UPI0036678508